MALYEDLQGTLLDGRYRVTGRLGSGAFGVVVAADQESLGLVWRKVALKLFTRDYVTRERAATVFREALLLEELAQAARSRGEETHLVTVHDVGILRDYHHTPFVAMEFVDGGSLRDRLLAAGSLPLRTVLDFSRAVCAGLTRAHEASPPVIHRDLKPENVLLTRGGTLKLADFGLAIDRYQAFLEGGQTGTIGYFPPESREGVPASPAFDVYSLGVMMLELLTGENPLVQVAHRAAEKGRSPDGDLAAAQERLARLEHPLTGRSLVASFVELRENPRFHEVLYKCLALSPGARFADARALVAALASDESVVDPSLDLTAEGQRCLRLAARHLSRNELDEARSRFERAAELLPRNPRVCFGLAQVAERQGRLEESIRLQQRGLELERTSAGMERLAELYDRSGRASEARTARLLARTLGGSR